MTDAARNGLFASERIVERQTHELMGIARGLIADGQLNDSEIHFLHRWLVANDAVRKNPMVGILLKRIEAALADGVIDEDERAELDATLVALTGNDFELGEMMKSTSLPLCSPAPQLSFEGKRLCFTGTFTFGTRRDCEAAVAKLGSTGGSLTQKTNFLVIGEYVTDSWKHTSYGNKITQAVQWREAGIPIAIVSEKHWRQHI